MGVNYDVAYDRALNPPMTTTGNGLLGSGPCTRNAVRYEHRIRRRHQHQQGVGRASSPQMYLNGGAPSGDGGINSIDPTRLERDRSAIRSIRGTLSASIRFSELSMAREVTRPGLTSIRRIRPWAAHGQ